LLFAATKHRSGNHKI